MPATQAVAIVGATASGKTAVSLELASLLTSIIPVEIISADSRQCYRHLTIGTAKPTVQERTFVPHHFIDYKNPDELFSAGDFGSQAASVLDSIALRGALPLIVGGAGLYVQALCDGLFDESGGEKTANSDYDVAVQHERVHLQTELLERGLNALYDELRTVDAVSAERYAERNPRYILRALEHFRVSGTPLSAAQATARVRRSFQTHFFGVFQERATLYNRINRRTEAMFADGIIEETASVLTMGYSPDINALNTVGYKECRAFLRGEYSRGRALELTQQNTRRYAKRQLTWFRRDERIQWCEGTSSEVARQIADYIVKNIVSQITL
jgi:tRNA dimethylallyltransferase